MTGRMKVIFFWWVLFVATAVNSTESLIAKSGENRVQLLELFSSESCSSCPPADQWVSGLKDVKNLWKTFVPVVFHVDYWNHLNWKDEHSSEKMTQRQIAISKRWSNPSVYTPGMVVDGKEWVNWRKSVNHELPLSEKSHGVSLALYQKKDGSFKVRVTVNDKSKTYVVHLALLGMGVASKVTSGENSGKLLKHDFLILNWSSKKVDIKASEVDFEKIKVKPSQLALAAWIEEEFIPIPLQAVGGFIK